MTLCLEHFEWAYGIPDVLRIQIRRTPLFKASIDKSFKEATELPPSVSFDDSRRQLFGELDIRSLRRIGVDEVEPTSIGRTCRLKYQEKQDVALFTGVL